MVYAQPELVVGRRGIKKIFRDQSSQTSSSRNDLYPIVFADCQLFWFRACEDAVRQDNCSDANSCMDCCNNGLCGEINKSNCCDSLRDSDNIHAKIGINFNFVFCKLVQS